jgi:hypothetical protein
VASLVFAYFEKPMSGHNGKRGSSRKRGATGSDVAAGVFLFLLSSLSCQASRFARNPLPVPLMKDKDKDKDKDKEERRKRKTPAVTSL